MLHGAVKEKTLLHGSGDQDDDDDDDLELPKRKSKKYRGKSTRKSRGDGGDTDANTVSAPASGYNLLDDDQDLDITMIKKRPNSTTDGDAVSWAAAGSDDGLELTLVRPRARPRERKSKSRVSPKADDDVDDDDDDGNDHGSTDCGNECEQQEEEDSNCDYTYKDLLDRVFIKLHRDRPELQVKKRIVMKPPEVCPYGSRKTMFSNFTQTCATMHRDPAHVLGFMLAELGTSGAVDGRQRLVLKGRFPAKGVENIVRRYISEYVTCKMCNAADTTLSREQSTRLFYLECQSCGAKRSVPVIKMGFQAQTSRRAVR